MAKILVVDDDPLFSKFLAKVLGQQNHITAIEHTYGGILNAVRENRPDVLFLDVNLPDGNGIHCLPEISRLLTPPEVVIITGLPDEEGARLALAHGAWDYISKTDPVNKIHLAAERAIRFRAEKLAASGEIALKDPGMAGDSQALKKCLAQASKAALSDTPLLLLGETGTGKEVLARAIHNNSAFSGGSFVIVDCAALPAHLVESILFGHKKGAFTGADANHQGLVKLADGGTLFLDEVGELPLETQKKFLRLLQEKCYLPVGAGEVERSRFRTIAATNRDLDSEVAAGRFRLDLLHRIRSMEITLPPLRERMQDIPLLINHFLEKKRQDGSLPPEVDPEFLSVLENAKWTGNVRELLQVVEAALAAAQGFKTLFSFHLPTYLRIPSGFPKNGGETRQKPVEFHSFKGRTLEEARKTHLEALEKSYLTSLMANCGHDLGAAAQEAGLSLPRLYALLKHHRLPTPAKAKREETFAGQ